MDLFFRHFGKGHPLVILHGLYGSSDNWISIARRLENDFEIFILDARNHGQSPHSSIHSYNEMTNDVNAFFIQHNLEKAIIMGHSMGGKTAMSFAIQNPEKVSALIIADIAPGSPNKIAETQSQWKFHIDLIRILQSFNLSLFSNITEADSQLSAFIYDIGLRKFILKNLKQNVDKQWQWRFNLEAITDNLQNIIAPIDSFFDREITPVTGFPVLFLRGGKSTYIMEADNDDIFRIFPFAEIQTIENATHWLHAEQPDEFVKRIRDFIKS